MTDIYPGEFGGVYGELTWKKAEPRIENLELVLWQAILPELRKDTLAEAVDAF